MQIVSDWAVWFNNRRPDDGKAAAADRGSMTSSAGRWLKRLSAARSRSLATVRWRLIDLVQWLHEEFAVSLDESTLRRELKKLGYVKLTARPRHHAQNEHAMAAFIKGPCSAELAKLKAKQLIGCH